MERHKKSGAKSVEKEITEKSQVEFYKAQKVE